MREYHATYLHELVFFLAKYRSELKEKKDDIISSQNECQDLDYTKGKQKNEGNAALLR